MPVAHEYQLMSMVALMNNEKPIFHEFALGLIHEVVEDTDLLNVSEMELCRIYSNGELLDYRMEIEDKFEKKISEFYLKNSSDKLDGREFIDNCLPEINKEMLDAALICVPDLTEDEKVVVSEVALKISTDLYRKFEGIGAFGVFLERTIRSLCVERHHKHKLADEIDRLFSVLQYWYRNETDWRELDDMPVDFGLGYTIGLLSPALDLKPEWWALGKLYINLNDQLTTNQQSKRGGQKGSTWTTGMENWLSKKIAGRPTKKTKSGIALNPSNRSFAIAIKDEAINHNQKEFGYKWSNDQAAFEWIQKTLRKLLNSSR